MKSDRNEFLVEQINHLLLLVEMTGKRLRDDAALVEEHGGTAVDLQQIIQLHARAGDAMCRAVARTQKKLLSLELP